MKKLNNETYKELLNSVRPEYNKNDIWAGIEEGLDKKKKRRYLWLFFLSGGLLLGGLWFVYKQMSTSSTAVTEKIITEINNSPITQSQNANNIKSINSKVEDIANDNEINKKNRNVAGSVSEAFVPSSSTPQNSVQKPTPQIIIPTGVNDRTKKNTITTKYGAPTKQSIINTNLNQQATTSIQNLYPQTEVQTLSLERKK